MARTFNVVGVLAILVTTPLGDATAQSSGSSGTNYAPWGFDLRGMDLSAKPGDAFYRYATEAGTIVQPSRPIRAATASTGS